MIQKLIDWMDRNMPTRGRCGHWARKADLVDIRHQTAGWVLICQACYDKEHAWDKGEKEQ